MAASRGQNEDEIYGSRRKRPCKACTDFKDWASKQELSIVNIDKLKKRTECPLDKNLLGRNTWSFLHTMAAYYPDKPTKTQEENMKTFIGLFSQFYPCDYCAADLRERLETKAPVTKSRKALSQWFCEIHNEVNKKLGKSEFDCSKVDERWLDGWKDGSCG